jgi:hypothetical protein
METKVDKFVGDLGALQSKVDLAMASINLVQQEQVVALLKSGTSSLVVPPGYRVMGPPPSGMS